MSQKYLPILSGHDAVHMCVFIRTGIRLHYEHKTLSLDPGVLFLCGVVCHCGVVVSPRLQSIFCT